MLLISVSQAYLLSEVSIIPSGSLAPNTSVTASIQINLFSSGLSTFPEGNILQLVTDLDNAEWTWWVQLNGVGTSQPKIKGRVLQITSWELTYDKNVGRESVRVQLEGTAPKVSATQNKVIFDLLELDSNNSIIPNSEIQKTSLIVNPADMLNGIASLTNDLKALRTEIDKNITVGSDTSKAEVKYINAQQEITAAGKLPVSGYLSAIKHLTDAQTQIISGRKDLDESWALKQTSNAREKQARMAVLQDTKNERERFNLLCILGGAFVIFAIGSIITIIKYNRWKKAQKKEADKK
jgi:hypothetical protein